MGSTDCDEGMAEEPDSVQELESGCPSITKETSDFGCQVNTRGGQLMLKSVGTQTDHKVIFCDQNTQTEPELFDEEISISDDELDPANEHDITETVSPHKADPSFVPPKMDESDDDNDDDDDEKLQSDTENSTSPNPQEDVKFLVFEKELHELFKRCQECGEAVMKKRNIHSGYSALCHTEMYKWSHQILEEPADAQGDACWKPTDGLLNFTKWGHLHKNSIIG